MEWQKVKCEELRAWDVWTEYEWVAKDSDSLGLYSDLHILTRNVPKEFWSNPTGYVYRLVSPATAEREALEKIVGLDYGEDDPEDDEIDMAGKWCDARKIARAALEVKP